MKRMLAVGAGGMAGTLLRAWIYAVVPSGWELWVVNLLGSFLIGVAAIRLNGKSAELRLFLSTGFLGSFTTFSAFSSDWFHLLENSIVSGIMFGILMTVCSVVAAACGVWTRRKGGAE